MPNYWERLESLCAIAIAAVNSPLMYNTVSISWRHGHTCLVYSPLMYNIVSISWRHGHTCLVYSPLMYNIVSISWRHGHTCLVYSPLMYNTVSISWRHGHTFLAYSPLMYHYKRFLPQYTHCWSHSHIHPMVSCRMPCTPLRVCTPSTASQFRQVWCCLTNNPVTAEPTATSTPWSAAGCRALPYGCAHRLLLPNSGRCDAV